jgi:antitoxin HicB
LAFIATLEPVPAERTIIVRFPSLPEAITEGANEAEALSNAVECLDAALFFRMKHGEEMPAAGSGPADAVTIVPSADIALRVALYSIIRRRNLTPAAVAEAIGVNQGRVADVFATRRAADLGIISRGLRELGQPVTISVDAA